MIAAALHYEMVPDALTAGDYRADAIDSESDGEVYVAIFSGSDAATRAGEYARRKNH